MSEPDSKSRPFVAKRILLTVGLILLIAAAVAASRLLLQKQSAAVASFAVKHGEFVITLTLKVGELGAVNAEQISSPRVRGQLKITHLYPEGDVVEVGDLIIEFDRVEFEKQVTEREQNLEAAEAELEKTIVNQSVEDAHQKADIENQEDGLRLAQLQMEKMRFESFIEREEQSLKTRQAELALEQARKKIEAQRIVDAVDLRKQELHVAQQERELDRAQRDLAKLSVVAEKPGLVVYERIRKGSTPRPEKVRVGDEPWGGQTLVTLPDLSRMQVNTWVKEVDVDKLEVGNEVHVRLDALPGAVFHGVISSIGSLGHEREGDKNLKIFDITVEIEEEDSRLQPGMTAICHVIIETIPPRQKQEEGEIALPSSSEVAEMPLYIPLDAVFKKGDRALVYRMEAGTPMEQEVTMGKSNENYVVIEEGLGPNDRVALRDPTIVLEALGGVPDTGESDSATGSLE
jgi:multidrug resistance efflux pump